MRLIQFLSSNGQRRVARVDSAGLEVVKATQSTRELAMAAIRAGHSLAAEVARRGTEPGPDYTQLLDSGQVLAPLDHPDPAHCLVSGTGLTHLGSAATRDSMHQQAAQAHSAMTDTMRMFTLGLQGGKPPPGQEGAQPEWFYKGDGSSVVRPGQALLAPAFAEDAGEEPELTGLYVIADDGTPYRLGFALGNEFSDHVTERRNYLYLAHSKLRFCAFGPELRIGPLPEHLEGTSRIWRGTELLWEKPFLSGEANMCHSIENLEYHHFKYAQFLRPGDVHIHYFGTATLSFADGVQTQPGDRFEISLDDFGAPLSNPVGTGPTPLAPGAVRAL